VRRAPIPLSNYNNMPSNSNCEPHTPPRETKQVTFDTIQRTRFYDAWDHKEKSEGISKICKGLPQPIAPSTGRKWLKQREQLGSPALRRTRKLSERLGRKPVLSESTLDEIIDPEGEDHSKPYQQIVKDRDLAISAEGLQQNCSKRKNAKRYKKPYTKKISIDNKGKRVFYGQTHHKKVIRFWRRVYFTDEGHFNSRDLANKQEYDLCQPGTAERLENLREDPELPLNVTFHLSGGITYDHKGELIFYNDPKEPAATKRRNPTKPRKSTVETDAEYQQKVEEWQASLPKEPEIKSPGNSMNMQLYVQEILPKHIACIHKLERKYGERYWLQEDNDGSHGTRSINNKARRLKVASNLQLLTHPAQSPDLNPIEAVWNIMKQRLRGGRWKTAEEFREAIVREWKAVSIAQIRRRIREMPERCKKLMSNGGERIKSELW
jgi:transposase